MTNFYQDGFAGSSGTDLSVHSPTIGNAYTPSVALPGPIKLTGSGKIYADTSSGLYLQSAVPGTNPGDGTFTFPITLESSSDGDTAGWVGRCAADLSTFSKAIIAQTSGVIKFSIGNQTGNQGSTITLNPGSLPVTYNCTLTLNGSDISGTISGGELTGTQTLSVPGGAAPSSNTAYGPLLSPGTPTTHYLIGGTVSGAPIPATTIPASDSTFLTGVFGEEWDKSHAAGSGYVINAGAPASDIDLNVVYPSGITGAVTLNFDTSAQGSAASGTGSAWIIEVDGVTDGTIHLIGPNDASSLSTASLTASATHRVRFVNVGNTSGSNRWSIGDPQTAKITGVTIPASASLAASSRPSAWELHITDSIGEGFHNINTTTSLGSGTTNNYYAWTSIVTRSLTHKLVGSMYSGIGVTQDGIGVPYGALNLTDNTRSTDLWDHVCASVTRPFATAPARIVLAVGTNEWATDSNTTGHSTPDAQSSDANFQANLQTWIAAVRAKSILGAVPIVIMVPFGGYKRAPIRAAVAAYIAANPSETHLTVCDLAHGSPALTTTSGIDEVALFGGLTKNRPDDQDTIHSAQAPDRTHPYAVATSGIGSVNAHSQIATVVAARGFVAPSGAMTAGTIGVSGTSGSATLTATRVTGGSAPYTYQFKKSLDGGTTWTNAGSAIDNQASTINPISVSLTGITNGTQFRIDATDQSNTPVTVHSSAVTYVLPVVTGVVVSPSSVNVFGGGSRRFSAVVNGTGNISQDVTWETSAGSIDSTGLLTVPSAGTNPQTITVTARSVDDDTKIGSATVIVPAGASTAGSVRYMSGMVTPAGQDGVQIAKLTYMLGDAAPDLEAQFIDSDGNPLDLTGYTVEFDMGPPGGSPSQAVIDRAAAALPYPAKGFVTYSWAPNDLATPGTYRARFYAIAPNGKTISSGVITVIVKDRFSN